MIDFKPKIDFKSKQADPTDVNIPQSPRILTQPEKDRQLKGLLRGEYEKPAELSYTDKFMQKLPSNVLGTAGGMAGASAGVALGQIPPFTILPEELITVPMLATAGAWLGGGIGRGAETLTQEGRLPTGKEFIVSGNENALAEIGGRAGGGFIKMLAAPFAKEVIPEAVEMSAKLKSASTRMPTEDLTPYAKKLLEKKTILGKQRGVGLSPAQMTQSKSLDYIESATESSLFGGNKLYTIKKILAPKAYEQLSKETADEFWKQAGGRLSPTELGELFIDTVSGGSKAARSQTRMLFSQLDQESARMTKNVLIQKPVRLINEERLPFTKIETVAQKKAVDLRGAKSVALEAIKEIEDNPSFGSVAARKRIAKEFADKVTAMGDYTKSFMQAHDIRSDLGDELRKIEGILQSKQPKIGALISKIDSEVDTAMEKAAKAYSPEVYDMWRNADAATKEYYKTFQNKTIQSALKLAENDPQLIAPAFFKPKDTVAIQRLRTVVDQKTFDSLKAGWIESIMQPASGEKIIDKSFLKKFNSMGDDTLKSFMPQEQIDNIRQVAKIGEIIRESTGEGGLLMKITQAGVIVSGVVGAGLVVSGQATDSKLQQGSGAILLGPAIISMILANPAGAKWLTTGLKIPKVIGGDYVKYAPPIVARAIMTATKKEEDFKTLVEKEDFEARRKQLTNIENLNKPLQKAGTNR